MKNDPTVSCLILSLAMYLVTSVIWHWMLGNVNF